MVTTGEQVRRETLRPGAVLTRVAASHIRVGTFQYAAARKDDNNLRLLADYTITRHYPELVDSDEKYAAFLRAVIARQAQLIVDWQRVGFIHGVMNTDNMALSGETIDYGPCAFLDSYHPGTVFSSIDENGRYAFGNQPAMAHWNLSRFAESLLPLLGDNEEDAVEVAVAALNTFPELYEDAWLTMMRQKLGLKTADEGDPALIEALLTWMQQTEADYTNTFRTLTDPTGIWSSVNGFRVPELAWQQSLRDGEVVVVAGMISQRNYLDGNAAAHTGRGEFMNSALIHSQVMPLAEYNFGVNLQWQPRDEWYAMAGASVGNAPAG